MSRKGPGGGGHTGVCRAPGTVAQSVGWLGSGEATRESAGLAGKGGCTAIGDSRAGAWLGQQMSAGDFCGVCVAARA